MRAALTGLKKVGYAIESDKVDGVRTYRAVAPNNYGITVYYGGITVPVLRCQAGITVPVTGITVLRCQ